MSYPEIDKGNTICAFCGEDIRDEFVTIRDNHLIINYFSYEDGTDNIFCDKDCLCEALFVETIYIEELEE